MFACTFEDYVGFGDTALEAWENLRVELEATEFDETEPEECVFFKSISVEITREFNIEEIDKNW